ncbi:MAG: hypothetical protein EBQ89_00585 [Alphaproteobacteria bacterium]|nr:hypothetical protein [Alphaproteobacteria bacterium]
MPDGPFLLSEEEQDEENRAQREAFAEAQLAAMQGRPPRKPARNTSAQGMIQDRVTGQQAARRASPFATGMTPMMDHGSSGAYHAAMGAAQQGNVLGNMIAQTMEAHQDENDSRVAQMREMRRMEHERAMKQMEIDALLSRLDQARQSSGPQPRAVFRGGAIY